MVFLFPLTLFFVCEVCLSVAQAAKDAQLVVEAVPDRLDIKSRRAFTSYIPHF